MLNTKLSACILAGGKGTRLRPLTNSLPKPLVKLLDKPIIDYILELLCNNGVVDVRLALGFHADLIKRHLSDFSSATISFHTEQTPLGTAGATKNAMKNVTSDFIVMSGDAMCDFDLKKAYEFHIANNSLVTIIGTHVKDPREYGLILKDEQSRVLGFLEKPSYHSCITDCASSGIYIVSPKILPFIKDDCFEDFAADIFPYLLTKDYPIFCYEDEGYWCDIGDLQSYRTCQYDMLANKVKFTHTVKNIDGLMVHPSATVETTSLQPPLYIGDGATVLRGATILKNSVIGENAMMCENSIVLGSVVLSGGYIARDCALTECVVASGVRLCENVNVQPNAVIGEQCTIGKDTVICDGVRVQAYKQIESGITLSEDLSSASVKRFSISEDGINGELNITITPELMLRLGSSIASLKPYTAIGVSSSYDIAAQTLYTSLCAGITSAGGIVWDFGSSIKQSHEFCLAKSMAEYGVYIDGKKGRISLYEKGGLSLCRATERRLEGMINHSEFKRVVPSKMGHIVDMQSLQKLYPIELLKQANTSLENQFVNVKTANKQAKLLLQGALSSLMCNEGDDITISLSGGLTIFDGKITLTRNQILTLVCMHVLSLGEPVYIRETDPRIIDRVAEMTGQKVHRYSDCPCSDFDITTRQKAIDQPYLRDELMMAIRVASMLSENGGSLEKLASLVPDFEQSNRLVALGESSASQVLERLSCGKLPLSEGVLLSHNGNEVKVRPTKSGEGIMIFAEVVRSQQAETASEICDIFEQLIEGLL